MSPTGPEAEAVNGPSPDNVTTSHALSMSDADHSQSNRCLQSTTHFDDNSVGDHLECAEHQRHRLRARLEHASSETSPLQKGASSDDRPTVVNTTDAEHPRIANGDRQRDHQPTTMPYSRYDIFRVKQLVREGEGKTVYTLRTERHAYHRLLSSGGRPAFPLSLLTSVVNRHQYYRKVYLPWAGIHHHILGVPDQGVLYRQLLRWTDFQEWQRIRRGQDEEGFENFVQRQNDLKEYEPKTLSPSPSTASESESHDRSAHLAELWERERPLRQHKIREKGYANMQSFNMEMNRRMSDIGIPFSFHLEENPEAQNKLTTWIEYLCFEDEERRDLAAELEANKQRSELAFAKLTVIDSFPAPLDMDDKDLIVMWLSQEQSRRSFLYSDFNAAEQAFFRLASLDRAAVENGSVPKHTRDQIKQAEADMEAAKKDYEAQVEKHEAIRDYYRIAHPYYDMIRPVETQKDRVEWVRSQIPDIVREMETAAGKVATPAQLYRGLPLSACMTSLGRAASFPSPRSKTTSKSCQSAATTPADGSTARPSVVPGLSTSVSAEDRGEQTIPSIAGHTQVQPEGVKRKAEDDETSESRPSKVHRREHLSSPR